MSEWMITLVNLSLAASTVAMVVLLVRLLFYRLPKIYSYVLWIGVFFRAICPVSFSSPFSLFRIFSIWETNGNQLDVAVGEYRAVRLAWILGQNDEQAMERMKAVFDAAGITSVNEAANAIGGNGDSVSGLVSGGMTVVQFLFYIWLAGVAFLLLYSVISGWCLRRKVSAAVKAEDGCFESDLIPTAFVLGIWKPRIYLPAGLSPKERELVKAHEDVHLRRKDHWYKMAAWLITIVHWFNPFLWLAFGLLGRDMEMSCDEKVLQNLGGEERKEYSSFLLALAAPAGFPSGSPLTFGEASVKARIKNILRYRKGSKVMGILAVVVAAIVLLVCLSNPTGQKTVEMVEGTGDSSIAVIGGSDGPTSVFLAGKLSGETSREEMEETLGEDKQEMLFAIDWASAVASRDAERVYEMLSPELKSRSQELGIEIAENGARVMGWSSPFVPEEATPMVFVSLGDEIQAEITYPAMTSEPSWWVWKDYLTFEKAGDTFQVTAWNQCTFFEIDSLALFLEAYRFWTPNYQHENGMEKSFAEYLQEHYDSGQNADAYEVYLSPAQAAEAALHLSGGKATVSMKEDGVAAVRYEWEDGTVDIDMIQPVKQGSGGIWVPEGWSAAVEE